jgi:hypothetical protein
MNRGTVIALVGSVLAVGLAFLVVVWLVPPVSAPPRPDDIRGKWRTAQTSNCSEAQYIEITDDTLFGLPPASGGDRPTFDLRITRDQQGPMLNLHIPVDPSDEIIVLRAGLGDGQLRFLSAEWSKETVAKYGSQVDTAPLGPVLAAFQRLQPYARCP